MKFFSLFLAFSISCAVTAPKANAYMLVNSAYGGYAEGVMSEIGSSPLTTILCVLLLPVCLLDEVAPEGMPSFTEEDLLNNGYTLAEIGALKQGQAKLSQWLRDNDLKLVREGSMDPRELAQTLGRIEGMTPEYVQFVLEN